MLGNITDAEGEKIVKDMAKGFGSSIRTPILKNPSEYGLEYESVTFPALDGVPLKAWYVPKPGSQKLVIVNHPRWFNRYGLPGHIEPWRSIGANVDPGNAIEVNFVLDIKILHYAGYNVLTGDANGGIASAGRFEARDVIGSLNYVRGREDLKNMSIGLFSRCNGANATFFAMHQHPEEFKNVRCLVACQPLSVRAVCSRMLENFGIGEWCDRLDLELRLVTSFGLDDMSPVPWAKSDTVPTYVYQVKDDKMTYLSDVEVLFDNIQAHEKKLHWITGTTARWDCYLEFQRRPEPMLEWLDKYMSS